MGKIKIVMKKTSQKTDLNHKSFLVYRKYLLDLILLLINLQDNG